MLRPNELLIHDDTDLELYIDPIVNGEKKSRGGIPRDFSVQPAEMFDPPSDMPLIPPSEYAERITSGIANKSQLSDIRLHANNGKPIPSLDQGQNGYCWTHSVTQAVIMDRACKNLPYIPLSAYCVAATIKKGRNEGGWCGLAAQFFRDKGTCSQAKWPQGDRNYQKYANDPSVWEEAQLYRIEREWCDLTRDVYDQNLTFAQLATAVLLNQSGPVDFNHWSHSVDALDLVNGNGLYRTDSARHNDPGRSGKLMTLVEYELAWGINHPVTAGYGLRIWNSWTDDWSNLGMGVLTGSKAIPDGAMTIRGTTMSQ